MRDVYRATVDEGLGLYLGADALRPLYSLVTLLCSPPETLSHGDESTNNVYDCNTAGPPRGRTRNRACCHRTSDDSTSTSRSIWAILAAFGPGVDLYSVFSCSVHSRGPMIPTREKRKRKYCWKGKESHKSRLGHVAFPALRSSRSSRSRVTMGGS